MEEENNQQSEPGQESSNIDYIEAIKKIKETSVDRSKYDELKAENKKLLDSIINGADIGQQPEVKKESIEELRAKYLKEDQTNLEYITNALNLRQALIDDGQPDPFLPTGSQILPTDQDVAAANKVAEVLQECVEEAKGDSDVFTNELQRRLVDVKIR